MKGNYYGGLSCSQNIREQEAPLRDKYHKKTKHKQQRRWTAQNRSK